MIGSHLVAEMVRAGYTDIVLPVRNTNRISNIERTFRRYGMDMPDGILTVVETGLTDADALAEVLRGVDTVFDCAAAIMTGDLTADQLIENNTAISRAIAGASVAAGVRRIVHTSSIIVLAADEGRPITEENTLHGDTHGAPYARSKYLSEMEMRRAGEYGVGLTVLYPAVVLGEGDWSLKGSSALVPVMASGQPFYTDGVMAYVDVCDVARAYIAVDSCPEAVGHGFIVAGANLSYRELFTFGAEAAGRRRPSIGIGRCALTFGYGVIKTLTALRIIKDMSIRKSYLDSLITGHRYSGEKLKKTCGFSYTPIKETIGRVVGAYLSEKQGR